MGEKILIGEDIEIVVCGVRPGVVKVGIHAPRTVTVRRHELVKAAPPPPLPKAGTA